MWVAQFRSNHKHKNKNMERTPVTSSNLRSIGYESETSTLEIEFNHGGVYQYLGVPEEVFDSLMQAGSHEIYFNENIKNSYGTNKL